MCDKLCSDGMQSFIDRRKFVKILNLVSKFSELSKKKTVSQSG
jgi:hypothetical protein